VRDAIWTVKRQRKSLVFVSPAPSLPPELEKDATLLAYPPPDADGMAEVVSEVDVDTCKKGEEMEGDVRGHLARAPVGLSRGEAARLLR
jgi:hypothetical protein